MSEFEEIEYLGGVGDKFDLEQQKNKEKFFEMLYAECGISEDKFNRLSAESKVNYLEKINIDK